ncbi:MAG: hypothetical protein CM15mP42_06080 [Methanobacteriota archaeon]|nr:MAG: hypothetical protein CM15mP42_06080 [Euryarchaeota archaeon]
MAEEKQTVEDEMRPPAIGGTFLTMAFMLWIIINPELRDFMGESAGAVLEPRITFDYQYPVLTFLFAGIIMISFTTIIRHSSLTGKKWLRFKPKWEHITKQWERQGKVVTKLK